MKNKRRNPRTKEDEKRSRAHKKESDPSRRQLESPRRERSVLGLTPRTDSVAFFLSPSPSRSSNCISAMAFLALIASRLKVHEEARTRGLRETVGGRELENCLFDKFLSGRVSLSFVCTEVGRKGEGGRAFLRGNLGIANAQSEDITAKERIMYRRTEKHSTFTVVFKSIVLRQIMAYFHIDNTVLL